MRMNRSVILITLMVASCGIMSANVVAAVCNPSTSDIVIGSLASPYSGNGCFVQDDNQQSFLFSITDPLSLLVVQTTSWSTASGLNGFEPILTLFNAAGNQLFTDEGGIPPTCGARLPGLFGTCLDAYISASLLPVGSYRLVLTEWDNRAIGNFSPDANGQSTNYSRYGQAHFTSDVNGCATGGTTNFLRLGVDCSPATNRWAVNVAVVVPEPSTALIGLSGVLLTVLVARRRRAGL